jgi:hypothetical protein
MRSSDPVKTTVLPEMSLSVAGASGGRMVRCATSRSMEARSRSCPSASVSDSATVAPMPSMPIRSSQAARASSGRAAASQAAARTSALRARRPSACARRASSACASSAARWAAAAGMAAQDGLGEGGPVVKWRARSAAATSPTWRMPSAKISRASGMRRFLVDRIEQVRRRFLAPALAVLQLLQAVAVARLQLEDVRRLRDPAIGVKRLHLLGAQPLDVEGRAADEMLQLFNGLRGADQAAGAAAHAVALLPHGVGAAFGAGLGEGEGHGIGGPLGKVHIGDLRDHVARAIDLHPVADADVLALADRRAAASRPAM